MDYIREFDIRLDKEYYYAGEVINGTVILDTVENFKLRMIRVILRGQAHVEWKVLLSGDRRTVKDDQYYIDERQMIWGEKSVESAIPILPRGAHRFPFRFQLPESALPCSFESRTCTIRYWVRAVLDVPYASAPSGSKYFTLVGPHIDAMAEANLRACVREARRGPCLCWGRPLALRAVLERSAYVGGEALRLKATVDNQRGDQEVALRVRLEQCCDFYADRVLGSAARRSARHLVLEYRAPTTVRPRAHRHKWDSAGCLVLPALPTTLQGSVCRLAQIQYVLTVSLDSHKEAGLLEVTFPITIATVPFRIPNSNTTPNIKYEHASSHVEGGMYIGPEFLLGQVYDGTESTRGGESVVLYRPVYVTVEKAPSNSSSSDKSTPQKQAP